MEKIVSNTIRVTCFCYAKEIPIASSFQEFLKYFMKSFDVNISEIKGIKFTLHIFSKITNTQSRQFTIIIESEDTYKEVFIGEQAIIKQFDKIDQITALAEFPGSYVDKSRNTQSDPVNQFLFEKQFQKE